jgi:S-adenosylmethionine hydrolase
VTIYFLSDFGRSDEFVGVVHAVIDRRAPAVKVVDLAHDLPPHDVRAGALMLWRAAPWVAGGVVLAVVDPGVATDRAAVALRVHAGPPPAGPPPPPPITHLVGPDNGLLLPAAGALGRIEAAVELPVHLRHTFAGRDVFAPAAADLALGRPLEDLGRALDPAHLQVSLPPPSAPSAPPPTSPPGASRLVAEVLWIDRYGNAQLNLHPALLPPGPVEVSVAGATFRTQLVASYAAIPGPEPALVVDSYGLVALCCDRSSAAARLGLREGDAVTVAPADS